MMSTLQFPPQFIFGMVLIVGAAGRTPRFGGAPLAPTLQDAQRLRREAHGSRVSRDSDEVAAQSRSERDRGIFYEAIIWRKTWAEQSCLCGLDSGLPDRLEEEGIVRFDPGQSRHQAGNYFVASRGNKERGGSNGVFG